jgi:fido (protein-threonine AMPylation protein)
LAIPWNEDRPEDQALIERNLVELLQDIAQESVQRPLPTVELAKDWHRRIYRGMVLPVAYYAGEIRDSDPEYPELVGYEVAVGPARGTPSARVPDELLRFEQAIKDALAVLDPLIPVGTQPAGREELYAVLTLCAHSHGEWVRIHPFANGNGRTARLWANWCALRYGLPPFVQLKPRPAGDDYARAAATSMQGDHRSMILVFTDMLDRYQEQR